MKVLFIFLTIMCTLYCKGEDNHGTMFYNDDGSQNAYFIDTIHIDSLTIVISTKNGHIFAIRNPSPKSLKGHIWDLPNTYIYEEENYFGGWYFKDMPDKVIPNDLYRGNNVEPYEFNKSSNAISYQIISNIRPAKYYWLVLIRGDAYNYITVRSVFDNNRKVIKFKDEKAYYKMLIPVWGD